METYPLAIYTAEHGLAWNYPRDQIDFATLDACRKAFGRLPEFDAGERGFDALLVTSDRIFVLCCQEAPAWDFRGRDAVYLAVTWVPRAMASQIDFERLLSSSALRMPTHQPLLSFEASASCTPQAPVFSQTQLEDGFSRAGALIAGLPSATSATLRRLHGDSTVSLSTPHAPSPYAFNAPTEASIMTEPAPIHGLLLPWPLVVILSLCWLATIGIAVFFWFKARPPQEPPTPPENPVQVLPSDRLLDLPYFRLYGASPEGDASYLLLVVPSQNKETSHE